ncbi:GIY-YIG nuclease family protein [Euhalothece natronophila Z-M001]|uniref:GIY-YIG nuclease family protein n=1 Tax=Euhalothece natronophila Z-M001 TaxID=522448 RepID=A0A5B8NPP5_9CHRO|nr:GIY-YIG nuclease family protein [Euhalothece natronophila]QDZ40511.1 GIY-YIG nuclease family protein [Euhalothece natronophila Z-M001]
MTSNSEIQALANLDFLPYLNENGEINPQLEKKIGVYGIFNSEKILQLVAYSRDIYTSLKQHLVRQPQSCYWVKLQTIDRPSRRVLAEIQQAWIEENGTVPPGNSLEQERWTEPIDATFAMTEAEKQEYNQGDEIAQTKLLKNVSRRVEAEIKQELSLRGVKMDIRFNPKLKEKGRLDLK